MLKQSFLSVAIITWNRSNLLEKCLESLTEQTIPPKEVIVIDNNSTDSTKQVVQRFRGKLPVRYIVEPTPGIPYARNRGIKEAKEEIIAFIDDDCEASADWVEEIIKAHQKYPQAIAIQGSSVSKPKDTALTVIWETIFDIWIKHNLDDDNNLMVIDTKNISFKLPRIKKEKITFDTRFLRGSDLDLAKQILHKGLKIYYYPEVLVYHRERDNIIDFIRQKFKIGQTQAKLEYKWPNEFPQKTRQQKIEYKEAISNMGSELSVLQKILLKVIFIPYRRMFKLGYLSANNWQFLKGIVPIAPVGRISVVIVTRNRPNLLAECLFTLSQQTYKPSQVLVIDNYSSSDATKKVALSFLDVLPIKYVLEKKIGVSYARNRGIKEAKEEIIAFIDDDCEASADWVEEIIKAHQKYPQAIAIQGNGEVLPRKGVFSAVCQRDFNKWISGNILINGECLILDTANASFKKKLFIKNNLSFDSSFKLYYYAEDIDLSKQVLTKKLPIHYCPEIKVGFWRKTNIIDFIKQRFLKGRSRAVIDYKWHFSFDHFNETERLKTAESPKDKVKWPQKPYFLTLELILHGCFRLGYFLESIKIIYTSLTSKKAGKLDQKIDEKAFYDSFEIVNNMEKRKFSFAQRILRTIIFQIFLHLDFYNKTTDYPPLLCPYLTQKKKQKPVSVLMYANENMVDIYFCLLSLAKQTVIPQSVNIVALKQNFYLNSLANAFGTIFEITLQVVKKDDLSNVVKNQIATTESGVLAVIDSSCEALEGWLEAILNAHRNQPKNYLIQGYVYHKQYQSIFKVFPQFFDEYWRYKIRNSNNTVFDRRNFSLNINKFKKLSQETFKYLFYFSDYYYIWQDPFGLISIGFTPEVQVSAKYDFSLHDFIKQRYRGGRSYVKYYPLIANKEDVITDYTILGLRDFSFLFGELVKKHWLKLDGRFIMKISSLFIFLVFWGKWYLIRKPIIYMVFLLAKVSNDLGKRMEAFYYDYSFERLNKEPLGSRLHDSQKSPGLSLSVMIITKDRADLLKRCLTLLTKQTVKPNEVVIVDSSKTPLSQLVETFKRSFPITYAYNANTGFGQARNLALQKAKGDIIATIDDDEEAPSDWCENILKAHHNYPQALAIQGRIISKPPTCYYAIIEQLRIERWFLDNLYYDGTISTISTKNVSFKKQLLLKYKIKFRNDTRFGKFGAEDLDIAHKIITKQQLVLYVPSIKVYHLERLTLAHYLKQQYRKGRSNALIRMVWFDLRKPRLHFSMSPYLRPIFELLLNPLSRKKWYLIIFLIPNYYLSMIYYRKGLYESQKELRSELIGPDTTQESADNLFSHQSQAISFAVAIVTRNRAASLNKALFSLTRQTILPRRVIIIDNGSTDNTVDIINEFKNNLPIQYYFEKKAGIAKARNLSLKLAKENILTFIDDDCEASADWVEEILKAHDKYPYAIAVQGRSFSSPQNSIFSVISQFKRQTRVRDHMLGNRNLYWAWMTGKLTEDFEILFCDSRNLSLKMSSLRRLHIKFNEDFDRGSDTEFSKQLLSLGQHIIYYPKACVWHHERKTLAGFLTQAWYQGRTTSKVRSRWPAEYHSFIHHSFTQTLFAFTYYCLKNRFIMKLPLLFFVYLLNNIYNDNGIKYEKKYQILTSAFRENLK